MDIHCGYSAIQYFWYNYPPKTPSATTSKSKSGTSKGNKSQRIFKNVRIHSGSLSDLHTILLTFDNEIITFGSNHTHQCSHLRQENMIQLPSIINKLQGGIDQHLQIDSVIAAGSATLLLCVSSTSWHWIIIIMQRLTMSKKGIREYTQYRLW